MDISYIIASFGVAQIIFAPLNTLLTDRFGTKNTMLIGFSMLAVTSFGLGAIANIKDQKVFLYTAIALRFVQGYGDVIVRICCFTIATSVFMDQLTDVIRYCEIAIGLGYSLGPVLGSALYERIDYAGTMYIFGGITLVNLILCKISMPEILNQVPAEDE